MDGKVKQVTDGKRKVESLADLSPEEREFLLKAPHPLNRENLLEFSKLFSKEFQREEISWRRLRRWIVKLERQNGKKNHKHIFHKLKTLPQKFLLTRTGG